MDKTAKAKLLQLIQTGKISVDELRAAQNEDLNPCGGMFIKNDGEGNGYDSTLGHFTDEEFEAWSERFGALNDRRVLLGLPEILSLVLVDSAAGSKVDINYAVKPKSGDDGNGEVYIFHIPDNGRGNSSTETNKI